ncbi:MAG: cation/H(+) antiporter [Chlorobiaceae bacterium]|nr:cation/H(+) antiporter [Chlorobiaceae bacterium]MBA4310546.1 cation/H(+) antiporter [Chlorobiaceae bacterium]
MTFLEHNDLVLFFAQIAILLLFAKVFGEVARRLKLPSVIGEILAGIFLGPTLLGSFFPEFYNHIFLSSESAAIAVQGLATIGVVLLLFVVGSELELSHLLKEGKNATVISLSGVIFPFILGFASGWLLFELLTNSPEEHRLVFSLFLGTALSISALPVIAKTLIDLNLIKHRIGRLILISAMIDDLIGWILFSIILGIIAKETASIGIGWTIAAIIFFVIFSLTFGKIIFQKTFKLIHERLHIPGGIISFSLIACFAAAMFTEYIGTHAVFGAFIFGIAIGNTVYFTEQHKEMLNQFVTNIFTPLFFVTIGLKINFIENFEIVIVLVVLIISFVAKVIGVGVGAHYFARLPIRESFAIGFGLNARGAIGIILGVLALQAGVIEKQMFVALVIMALVTSVVSGPLMSLVLRKNKSKIFDKNF